jgi:hypothetical protein
VDTETEVTALVHLGGIAMEIVPETDTETVIVTVTVSPDDVTTATRPGKTARKRWRRRRKKRRSQLHRSHLSP